MCEKGEFLSSEVSKRFRSSVGADRIAAATKYLGFSRAPNCVKVRRLWLSQKKIFRLFGYFSNRSCAPRSGRLEQRPTADLTRFEAKSINYTFWTKSGNRNILPSMSRSAGSKESSPDIA